MITLYRGRRGKGKTTTMVKDAYNYFCYGWKIYTNMDKLGFPHEQLSVDDIVNLHKSDIENCVLMIDEIQAIVDNRRGMKKENVSISNFFYEIRKRSIVLLATTQFSRNTDLRFRDQVDIIAHPSMLPEYPVVECVYTDLTATEDNVGIISRKVIYNPTEVFKLFNTNERVKSVNA